LQGKTKVYTALKSRFYGFFASFFLSVFPFATTPLPLQGTNPRNHGRKKWSICVIAPKMEALETAPQASEKTQKRDVDYRL
jgi:hypothetical protein